MGGKDRKRERMEKKEKAREREKERERNVFLHNFFLLFQSLICIYLHLYVLSSSSGEKLFVIPVKKDNYLALLSIVFYISPSFLWDLNGPVKGGACADDHLPRLK